MTKLMNVRTLYEHGNYLDYQCLSNIKQTFVRIYSPGVIPRLFALTLAYVVQFYCQTCIYF